MSRRTGTVTIREVASMAGVVPSTVSHVINNTAPVSAETRRRVFEAIQKLGYRRNALASSLRQQTTMTIGLLVPNIAEPIYSELARGISEEAAAAGYGIILGHTAHDPQLEEHQLARMLDRRVDGLIIVPDDDDRLERYRSINTPVVIINRQTVPIAGDLPTVAIDSRRAGLLATRHLLRLGHTRIGIITTAGANERHAGYIDAMSEIGATPRDEWVSRVRGPLTDLVAQGRQAMLALMRQAAVTACFVVDDVRALGALEALHDARRQVPEDMAIVGCGDLRVASLMRPRLTTVGHPKHRLGIRAMRLLIDTLSDSSAESHVIMPVDLVVRDSCGAIMRPAYRPGGVSAD